MVGERGKKDENLECPLADPEIFYFDNNVIITSISHHTRHNQIANCGGHTQDGCVHIIRHRQKYINYKKHVTIVGWS